MRLRGSRALVALGGALLAGCEPVIQTVPQAVTLHLSGPAESIGIWMDRDGERLLQCSALLLIQASGEGSATWLSARTIYNDANRPRALVVSPGELEIIFGAAVIEAGSEYSGQIYGEGTGTFRVDFVLAYETMVEEDPGPTREAAYTYTCRAP